MKKIYTFICLLFLLSIVGGCSNNSGASEENTFTEKEITIIVPWDAGGSTDIMARQLQPIFDEEYGVDVVIKNVPGGGSAVGLTELTTSNPDGYTVALASSSIISLMAL